ncbi:MAG: ROK family protein [Thermoleophilum sp.]|nr:ROK family protein [Thermoleophilum sp.]
MAEPARDNEHPAGSAAGGSQRPVGEVRGCGVRRGPVVGVDAGGTKVLAVRLGPDLAVERELLRQWQERGREAVIDLLLTVCRELADGEDPLAFGFGLPALVPKERGAIPYSTHLPLEGVDFRALAEAALGRPVAVDNDVNCALRGEAALGAARGARDAVMLTLGTGIGGAILCDGQLCRGARGFAGELGHIPVAGRTERCQGKCPGEGCLEAVASGGALDRAAREAAERGTIAALAARARRGEAVDGALVTALALAGDADCRALLATLGEQLGAGLVAVANAFDPEVIVIGGGLARAGELLLAPAKRVLRQRALPGIGDSVRVERAQLGERAGAVGAAIMALEMATGASERSVTESAAPSGGSDG